MSYFGETIPPTPIGPLPITKDLYKALCLYWGGGVSVGVYQMVGGTFMK